MEDEVKQLVEMVCCSFSTWIGDLIYRALQGATPAQARAALRQCKDVMQAAELFFEGKFDHIRDGDGDVPMTDIGQTKRTLRPAVSSGIHLMTIGRFTNSRRPQKEIMTPAPKVNKRTTVGLHYILG